ncbi:WASH complex subunit 2C isoform X4 [Dermochelys coriacea]|uniref:WASH complex subunit 2C isoform X4 n=1 Tax=Dermochelys coriacea TaxID=27794 RepID=UPI0018E7CA0B|nr:WASH complex subunit 2C isoform X4 [Dermochelys coriacea]
MERADPVWERAWALDEIRKGSQSWSLAADAGLLHFLQEFSQQTISRTHEIKKQVDGLIHETKATDCRLHNVFSDFLMLSNTQFIENRVYDEEVEEPIPKTEVGDKAEQEKTREQKEADLIPKIQEAVNYGLQVLDSAFEQLDIKAGNSDSEEEETNERVELILEPKDLYIDRPLPYLIGSQLFMERDDVGLGDFSSEEGSVDSDHGSVIDSEENDEEESDDEFGNPSEDDQKPVRRRTFVSDEEDGCDLFGESEKEEEDLEENTGLKKKRPTSFADELAARIKGDVPSKQDEEQSSLSAEIKTKKTVKEKKEVRVPSDDDEDDIFKPPKLTDEDFSPFGSKGGLFSGGMGLFDDEEESDLFAEAPRGEDLKEKELRAPINDEPSTKALWKVPVGAVSLFPDGNDVFSSASVLMEKENKKPVEQSADKAIKQPGKISLFDDDDFFVEPTNKHLKSVKATADFFDNDEGDLFKKKPEVVPAAVSKAAEVRKESMGGKKSQPSSTEDSKPSSDILPKNQRGLFSDEEDSEDLFSSSLTGKSKSTSLPPSKSATKAPLSLFDDEDEEDLFGTAPAKKQQSKLPQEKAKQSEPLKKVSGSLFSSDEEDHWNVSKPAKPISEDSRKGEPAKPVSAVDPANVVKKTSLFEEDEEEEDLFAITKDSQRKHQKASLLFEEDAVNGGPLFSSQPTRLPSAAKATAEKTKTPPAPPSLFDEEKEKEDLLDTSKTKLVEEKLGHSEEQGAVPVTEGTEAAGQQEKEKLEPFAASSLEPISNLDLFSASPPPQEKEAKTRTKNVLSLFEEEEEEKMEDQDVSKIERKEIRKSSHSKSTGVFQDEELLFSHKLQKDNDPDVDLFARSKKSGSAKLRMKLSSAGGLFGDDDEDDLFSIAKAKPPKVAEKKTVVKKDSSGPCEESSKGPQNMPSAKQDEGPKSETTKKSTGPVPIKTKEPSSRIGKLQANLAINPAALLPGEVPKISSVKPALPNLETPLHEPDGVQNAEGNSEEAGVSFDHPMQVDTLHNANKSRIKVMNKRRPPSRTARRLAAQESSENEELISTVEPQLQLPKQSSALVEAKELCTAEPDAKGSTENILAAKLLSPTDGGSLSPGMAGSPSGKGTGQEGDLFGSDYLFVKNSVTKPAAKAKTSEILASKPLKGGEKKPALSVLDNQGSNDLFQPIMQKASKKSSPISFLEDEDLFTSQKTVRKKELKSTTQQNLDPKVQDIFEDDIFATEAIKPLNRTKERVSDSNLFDDNTDIFASLTIKPKEKKTKKKVESIFDDDMDDIFSCSSQAKASTPKGRSSQTTSESKSESKASSTFDDPLNAFGGQ